MTKPDLSFLSREIAMLVQPVLEGPTADIAFDADGTLWEGDIGETFLKLLDDEHALPNYPNGGAWAMYQSMLIVDADRAYLFSTIALAGMDHAVVTDRAERLAKDFVPRNLFPQMGRLVEVLLAAKHRVWIISASNMWCIDAAAELLGVPEERAFGVQLQLDRQRRLLPVPMTTPIGEGKAEEMRSCASYSAMFGPVNHLDNPALAAGNSRHDRAMLELAKAAFVVRSKNAPNPDAAEMADQRNWPTLHV